MTDIKTVLTDGRIAEIASEFDIETVPGMLNHSFARAIEAAVMRTRGKDAVDAKRYRFMRSMMDMTDAEQSKLARAMDIFEDRTGKASREDFDASIDAGMTYLQASQSPQDQVKDK